MPKAPPNTITPSPQLPPSGNGASASVCGGPPATSMRLSLPPAKKPIDRLSGDQKGTCAPSVKACARADRPSRRRIHNCAPPSAPDATKAICLPVGRQRLRVRLLAKGDVGKVAAA